MLNDCILIEMQKLVTVIGFLNFYSEIAVNVANSSACAFVPINATVIPKSAKVHFKRFWSFLAVNENVVH